MPATGRFEIVGLAENGTNEYDAGLSDQNWLPGREGDAVRPRGCLPGAREHGVAASSIDGRRGRRPGWEVAASGPGIEESIATATAPGASIPASARSG